jgi:hypothetical protein
MKQLHFRCSVLLLGIFFGISALSLQAEEKQVTGYWYYFQFEKLPEAVAKSLLPPEEMAKAAAQTGLIKLTEIWLPDGNEKWSKPSPPHGQEMYVRPELILSFEALPGPPPGLKSATP